MVAQILSSLVIKHSQKRLTDTEKAHLNHLWRTERPYHLEGQKRDRVTQLFVVFHVYKKIPVLSRFCVEGLLVCCGSSR